MKRSVTKKSRTEKMYQILTWLRKMSQDKKTDKIYFNDEYNKRETQVGKLPRDSLIGLLKYHFVQISLEVHASLVFEDSLRENTDTLATR